MKTLDQIFCEKVKSFNLADIDKLAHTTQKIAEDHKEILVHFVKMVMTTKAVVDSMPGADPLTKDLHTASMFMHLAWLLMDSNEEYKKQLGV